MLLKVMLCIMIMSRVAFELKIGKPSAETLYRMRLGRLVSTWTRHLIQQASGELAIS